MEYQWYRDSIYYQDNIIIPGATEPSLLLSFDDYLYPYSSYGHTYGCDITAKDGNGGVLTLDSQSAVVYVEPGIIDWAEVIAGYFFPIFLMLIALVFPIIKSIDQFLAWIRGWLPVVS